MPTYTENNVNYSYTVGNQNAKVVSSRNAPGSVIILASFTVSGVTYNVKSIDNFAFYLSYATSITLPNSITNIGVQAFNECRGLTSITIPNSVITIDDAAFANCSGLTSITIPNSVITIGNAAFGRCTGLISITFENGIKTIGNNMFLSCTGLTSINIPNSVITIGNNAFDNCYSLTSVTMPISFTTVGTTPFLRCYNIQTINNNPITVSWRSISITKEYSSTPFFNGVFSTFDITNMTIINGFYKSNNLNTNVLTDTNDFDSDFLFKNNAFVDGIYIRILIPELNIYSWPEPDLWRLTGTNGFEYLSEMFPGDGVISRGIDINNFTINSITDPRPPPPPPAAPTGLIAAVSGTTATINFAQPTNGSPPVTSYTYATSSDNVSYSSFVNTNLIKVSATQVSISGLTNGSTYYFKLIAYNRSSSAESSESNSVFVNFALAAPTGLIATVSGTTATINFDQATNGSAVVTSYTYATSSDNVSYSSFVNTNLIKVSATQVSISGLTLGSTYYFKLMANNGIPSVASDASNSVFVNMPPPPPAISTVSYSPGSTNVFFTQNNNNGLPVTSYSYSTDNGQTYTTTTVITNPLVITGLKSRVQNKIIIKANNGLDSPDSNTFSFAYYTSSVGKKSV